MKIIYIVLFIIIFCTPPLFSQNNYQVSGFGHIEHEFEYFEADEEMEIGWALGEQSLFVSGGIGKKFSYLGEFAINYTINEHDHTSGFATSVRRARIKYNYFGNHSVIIGQMHTPVNYWNDVYYHARIFFPTTDRPLSFAYLLPVHSLGIRAQGQNLGKLNFGYDIQTGNSLEGDELNPAFIGAVHIKPTDGMRIGASFYYNHITDNSKVHHMHEEAHLASSDYEGALDYHLICFSFARFEKPLEILNEFSTTLTRTDSLGMAQSYSNYLYLGYNIKDRFTPYVNCDFIQSGNNDLRNGPFNQIKYGVGYKHEFSPALNLKLQVERYTSFNKTNNPAPNYYEFTMQFSYAIY